MRVGNGNGKFLKTFLFHIDGGQKTRWVFVFKKKKKLKRPRFFVVDVQIKQKYLSTFSPFGQPKIINHTKFFSSNLRHFQPSTTPNLKSLILIKQNKLFGDHLTLLPKFLVFMQSRLKVSHSIILILGLFFFL